MTRRLGEELELPALVIDALDTSYEQWDGDGWPELVLRQRGTQFDPRLADAFETHAEILLSELETTDTWDAVIGAEPALAVTLSDDRFDAALLAIADFHRPEVALLARPRARRCRSR